MSRKNRHFSISFSLCRTKIALTESANRKMNELNSEIKIIKLKKKKFFFGNSKILMDRLDKIVSSWTAAHILYETEAAYYKYCQKPIYGFVSFKKKNRCSIGVENKVKFFLGKSTIPSENTRF